MPLTNDGDADSKDNGVAIRQGLRQNLGQFAILIVVNAFVGAMIGLEQTVVPLIGKDLFGIESATIILSFISSVRRDGQSGVEEQTHTHTFL